MDIEAEIVAHFISNTIENDPYTPSAEQIQVLRRKLEVYEEITKKFPLELGKKISKDARENENSAWNFSFTYGEMDFMSMGELFYTINERYGGMSQGGIFYDLGSGIGKALIAAALLGDFSECRGIEIIENLHSLAENLVAEYHDNFVKFLIQNSDIWTVAPKITCVCADLLKYDWSDASMLLVNSTCFDEETISAISNVPVANGTISISLSKALSATSWLQLEKVQKKMSWGDATIYIQKKVDAQEQQKLLNEFGKMLENVED